MQYSDVEFLNVPYMENDRNVPLYCEMPDNWKSIQGTIRPDEKVYPIYTKDVFLSMKLSINYNEIMNCNYLTAVYFPSNGSETYRIYAWIDSIIPDEDNNDKYNCLTTINFHLDYWRMYIEKINIEEGLILNRPRISRFADPPQNIPASYYNCLEYEYPVPGQMKGIAWVIISYIYHHREQLPEPTTKIAYPVDTFNTENHVKYKNILNETVIAPSLIETMNGYVFNALGIESKNIQSCDISPIGPIKIIGKENDVLILKWRETSHKATAENLLQWPELQTQGIPPVMFFCIFYYS